MKKNKIMMLGFVILTCITIISCGSEQRQDRTDDSFATDTMSRTPDSTMNNGTTTVDSPGVGNTPAPSANN